MKTKEEKMEYDKQYRLNNKEKIKQYRLNNKEKIRQQRIEYDLKNKEKIKEQQREYKENHKEEISEYEKEYNINNKEKIKKYPSNSFENRKIIDKKYNLKNVDKIRNHKMNKRYGITLNQYNEMIELQQGKCKICGVHQNELNKILSIDHNHDTNVIRGLLCDKCNRGLGHFNDDIELIKRCVTYLENACV